MPTYFPISSGNTIKISRVTLLSADILELFTAPVILILAPGVNMTIMPMAVICRINFGTTAYITAAHALLFSYNANSAATTGQQMFSDIMILPSATNNTRLAASTLSTLAANNGTVLNKAFYVSQATANPTAGDSTMDVWVYYVINSN
jgi:hypothetical protein